MGSAINKRSASSSPSDESHTIEHKTKTNFFERWTAYLYTRLRHILKGSLTDGMADAFLKGFLIHDLAMAVTVVVGRYMGPWQIWIWVLAEVVLVTLVIKYRLFKSKVLLIRSIVIEVLFLLLVITIALVPLAN